MESKDAQAELAELGRLQRTTVREAVRPKRGAVIVLAVGTAAFALSYVIGGGWQLVAAPVVWCLFIVTWVAWLRHSARATPARGAERLRDRQRVELLSLAVAAGVVIVAGSRVSWLFVGTVLCVLGIVSGAMFAWRASHALPQ